MGAGPFAHGCLHCCPLPLLEPFLFLPLLLIMRTLLLLPLPSDIVGFSTWAYKLPPSTVSHAPAGVRGSREAGAGGQIGAAAGGAAAVVVLNLESCHQVGWGLQQA